MANSPPSHLVTIPVEVQIMIAEQVSPTIVHRCKLSREFQNNKSDVKGSFKLPGTLDLNSLCCTCQSLNRVVTPILYRCVVLRVQQHWDNLASIHNLYAYSFRNLKYTSSIIIRPKACPDENLCPCLSDDEDQSDEESRCVLYDDANKEYDKWRVVLPSEMLSETLNGIIRLLILEIPRNQLTKFV